MKIKLEIEIDPKEAYDLPKYINIPKLVRELNRIIDKLRELQEPKTELVNQFESGKRYPADHPPNASGINANYLS